MSHLVSYRRPDGKVGYHQTDDVHDAVSFVEQLRNDQGVEHARIWRMEQVNFEYRPYYRVELKAGTALEAGAPMPEMATSLETEGVSALDPEVAAANVADAAPVEVAEVARVEPVVDEPVVAEPVLEEFKAPEPIKTDPIKVEPKVEEVPSTPASTDSGNGVGARRGLFGR